MIYHQNDHVLASSLLRLTCLFLADSKDPKFEGGHGLHPWHPGIGLCRAGRHGIS